MRKLVIFPIVALLVSCSGNKNAKESANETDAKLAEQLSTESVQTSDCIEEQSEEEDLYLRLISRSYKVKANPNIEDFFIAMSTGISSYYESNPITKVGEDDEGIYEIDKKNGYLRHTVEGDGWYELQLCYWNRNDGNKLLAIYNLTRTFLGYSDELVSESFLTFFVCDKETGVITHIEDPIEGGLEGPDCLFCELPKKGKDIKYYYSDHYIPDAVQKTLKWNGMGFVKGE